MSGIIQYISPYINYGSEILTNNIVRACVNQIINSKFAKGTHILITKLNPLKFNDIVKQKVYAITS